MALSSPGIGSNLDVNSIISQLMAVEQRPLHQLAQKEASYQAKLSAFGSIKSALSSFQSAMQGLTSADKFVGTRVNVSKAEMATATATGTAMAGSYQIKVDTLAQAQKLVSGHYAATSDEVGSGTLTIQLGSYAEDGSFTANAQNGSVTIEIDPSNNSLAGVRDAINASDAGVTASIIHDGTGHRLVIGAKDSGAENAIRISVTEDGEHPGLAALAYEGADTPSMRQTVAAQNAEFEIDGVRITKASNSVTDAIEGVTLDLLQAADETFTLSITRDNAPARSAAENFVKAYNDLHKVLSDVSAYNAETRQGAILQGDSTVRGIQTQLRGLLGTTLDSAGGGLLRLSDIGISAERNGSLRLDTAKLNKVLDDPSKDVATLFASIAKPSDSLVRFDSAAADARAGVHELHITQLATQGKAVSANTLAAETTITAGSNDTLRVKIDGVEATITLSAGTYTAARLAAELQSKINGAQTLKDADVKVSVSQEGGVLTVTSDRYGSASKVEIIGGTASNVLFGAAESTDGLDVAGTIGGEPATGSGQKLTGLGITLEISGGALGARGQVHYARGFAAELGDMAKRFLEDDGLLDARTDGLNRSIKDLETQRERLSVRLEAVEKRYRAQFTALDVMLSSMLSTSNYLQQQLAALPKLNQQ